jgi:hypothetical protein
MNMEDDFDRFVDNCPELNKLIFVDCPRDKSWDVYLIELVNSELQTLKSKIKAAMLKSEDESTVCQLIDHQVRRLTWLKMGIEHSSRRDEIEEEYAGKIEARYNRLKRKYNTLISYLAADESKIVSAETKLCRAKEGEIHTATVLIYGNGQTTVRCSANCFECVYEL